MENNQIRTILFNLYKIYEADLISIFIFSSLLLDHCCCSCLLWSVCVACCSCINQSIS